MHRIRIHSLKKKKTTDEINSKMPILVVKQIDLEP